MAEQRNLHILPEVELERSQLRRWKEISPSEPRIRRRVFRPVGVSAEIRDPDRIKEKSKLSDRGFVSPAGLLFRVEDNIEFVYKVAKNSVKLTFEPNIAEPSELAYASLFGGSGVHTATSLSLIRALICYSAGWTKHFVCSRGQLSFLEALQMVFKKARLLLLAVDPGDDTNLRVGGDPLELTVGGWIPLSRIYVLNEAPELLRELIRLENDYSDDPMPDEEANYHLRRLLEFSPDVQALREGNYDLV